MNGLLRGYIGHGPYRAVLRHPTTKAVMWACLHRHETTFGTTLCAQWELDVRNLDDQADRIDLCRPVIR